jgi:ammonium transporter, Amt family
VINQIKGVLVVAIYGAMVSLIILKLIDIFVGLRVDQEIEIEGLDINLHGETVQ